MLPPSKAEPACVTTVPLGLGPFGVQLGLGASSEAEDDEAPATRLRESPPAELIAYHVQFERYGVPSYSFKEDDGVESGLDVRSDQ